MAYIEYHQELRWLWKVERMAEQLRISKAHALGLISALWLWVVANAPDGKNLKRFTDREIAAACGWEGNEALLRKVLRAVRWLDPQRDDVHEWDRFGLRLIRQSRERKQRFLQERSAQHDRNVPRNVRPGKKERRIERKKDVLKTSTGFEQFWVAYPRKVNKPAALKAWSNLAPDSELTDQIVKAVGVQRAWPQWVKDGGQFIPHPATWLNGRRWEDQEPTQPRSRSVADDLTPGQRARLKKLTSAVGAG